MSAWLATNRALRADGRMAFPLSYGDGVERSMDGYYWIKGRVDDVIKWVMAECKGDHCA